MIKSVNNTPTRRTRPPHRRTRPQVGAPVGVKFNSLRGTLPCAPVFRLTAHVWISRPPANAQFSHDVSLKQTMTFSVSMPA